MKPKLKHSGGLNGLTGSKDPVINRNQDTACPGKFKWGANIMEMCAHPCYQVASYFRGVSGTLLGLQTLIHVSGTIPGSESTLSCCW